MPYKNPADQQAAYRRHRAKHAAKIDARSAKWASDNPEKRKAALRRYCDRNAAVIREHNRLMQLAFPEKVLARVKRYQARHPARVAKRAKNYRIQNPDKVRETKRLSQRRLMAKSISARIKHNLRTRLGQALKSKGGRKVTRTTIMLGCSIQDFLIYLESRFEPGMTWKNYGVDWEIDHIMPCAIFDLTKPEHQRRCFHFSNQQPLPIPENRSKGAKVLSDQFQLL